jgi:hypothetical protein
MRRRRRSSLAAAPHVRRAEGQRPARGGTADAHLGCGAGGGGREAAESFAELGLVGLIVAGATGGGPEGVTARGWASLEEDEVLLPGHRFPAYSITKLITATVAGHPARAGRCARLLSRWTRGPPGCLVSKGVEDVRVRRRHRDAQEQWVAVVEPEREERAALGLPAGQVPHQVRSPGRRRNRERQLRRPAAMQASDRDGEQLVELRQT